MPEYQPTFEDPLGPNTWTNLTWPGMEGLHSGLAMLVGWDAGIRLRCVGTAFIISARGSYAVCGTAAHNFYSGLYKAQNPFTRHAPSTPTEFIANFETVDLRRCHAVYRNGDAIHACDITGAVWDKKSDLCFFEMEPQTARDDFFFQAEWPLSLLEPAEGDMVGVLGYAGMDVTSEDGAPGAWRGEISSQLMLRVGRVTSVKDGGVMTRGRCVETTIPVFGGMSGGPAFIWTAPPEFPKVFGLVSSDPEDPANDASLKNDFSVPGRSTAVAFPIEDGGLRETDQHFLIRIGPLDAVIGQQLRVPFYADPDGADGTPPG